MLFLVKIALINSHYYNFYSSTDSNDLWFRRNYIHFITHLGIRLWKLNFKINSTSILLYCELLKLEVHWSMANSLPYMSNDSLIHINMLLSIEKNMWNCIPILRRFLKPREIRKKYDDVIWSISWRVQTHVRTEFCVNILWFLLYT